MNANSGLTIDITAGFEHLQRLDATGMHQYAAIDPNEEDRPKFVTFRLNEIGKSRATAFLKQYGASRNVYYSINEVRSDLGDARAKKADILNIRMIGADLDPNKEHSQTPEFLASEFAKLDQIRQKVAHEPEHFYSFAVATGGGIQIGWRLREKLEAAQFREDVENQTRGILRHLGAEESTADITRLFRLPGTLNFPTAAKRRLGRTQVIPARIIEYIDDSEIDLSDFRQWAEPVSAPLPKASIDAAATDLDMSLVGEALRSGQLPAELASKFALQRESDDKLDRLWLGDKSAVGGSDTTGSSFVFALAGRLRRTGRFSPTEFGQIAAIWEHGSSQFDGRQLARAWARNGAAAPTEEFDAVTITNVLRGGIKIEPIAEFDALDIPKRQWVLSKFAAKKYLAGLVSPPGVGKTTFLLMVAVAIATGRENILGMKVHQRGRVFLWNQEDETDELKRRLLAVMGAFDVKWSDITEDNGKPRIILGSGIDRPLIFAKRNEGGYIVPGPDAKTIEDFLKVEAIDCAIFDPFVEMHEANENDNTEIAAVGAVFRRIAVKADCAVLLAHHTRKPPAASASDAYAGNMDTARGAGSLGGVARMVATLYTIDRATGKRYGIPENECHRYVRFDDAKANMSLVSGEPMFFRREGVTIGGFGGEEVGVLRPVKLSRVSTGSDKTSSENGEIRDAVASLLRRVDSARMTVKSVADDLIATGLGELVSPEALRKRLARMFAQPQTYENGDVVRSENAREKGKQGRALQLVLTIADKQT